MRRHLLFFFTVVALAASLRGADSDRHVVLVTIDGFPAYLFRDESIPLPHLRRLAVDGAIAGAMTVANPSVTWPNHTTLVTGVTPRKHGVLYNGLATRGGPNQPLKIEPWVDKSRLVRVPTVYDAAHAAGLTTAEVDWVAITRPGTITWSFPEVFDPGATLVREMIAAGAITAAEAKLAQEVRPNIVWRDALWTRAASFVFERHHPNLLLFHPLATDSTHHRFGPGSLASTTALTLADRLVGDLLRTIDASGRRDRTTVIVTTDHGFKKVERFIYPNVALRQAGFLRVAGAGVADCAAYTATQGGMAYVFIIDPARRAELQPRLRELLGKLEGVAQVIDGADAPAHGMPTPAENVGAGDLILYPKPGYSFTPTATGDLLTGPSIDYHGSHGFPASDPDLDGIFIAQGAGIKSGVKLDRMRNLDVAPTIARLLGIELKEVDGRVLDEILSR